MNLVRLEDHEWSNSIDNCQDYAPLLKSLCIVAIAATAALTTRLLWSPAAALDRVFSSINLGRTIAGQRLAEKLVAGGAANIAGIMTNELIDQANARGLGADVLTPLFSLGE